MKVDSTYEKLAQTTERIEETSVEVPSDQSAAGNRIVDIQISKEQLNQGMSIENSCNSSEKGL